jgi:hypothetical protein
MATATLGPRATCAALRRVVELGVDSIEIVDRDGHVHGTVDPAIVHDLPQELWGSPLVIVADLIRFTGRGHR